MRKIPTLYLRDLDDMRYVTREVHPDCRWVLDGEGVATRKYDGTCVLLDDDGHWWARREVKPGKPKPHDYWETEADPVTGKTVGWEPIEQSAFAKFHTEAVANGLLSGDGGDEFEAGTYELIGPKVNGNPEGAAGHYLVAHAGAERVRCFSLTFDGIRDTVLVLAEREGYEGLVWHHPDGRMAKIKRRDFPKTPTRNETEETP